MGVGFNSANCSYTGIEVDQVSVDLARKKGLDVYCVAAEDMDNSPVFSRKYDLIFSFNVFEHLNSPIRAFQNLSAMSCGAIVISVPNAHGLFARLKVNSVLRELSQRLLRNTREIVYTIDGNWHNIAYTEATLRHLCLETRLEPLKIMPISINDKVYGFVQPNESFLYGFASWCAGLLGMDSTLLLIARAER